MLWLHAVEWYLSGRDVSTKYQNDLRRIGRRLEEFSGSGVFRLDDLNDGLVNQFLEALAVAGHYDAKTRKHHRDAICTVWRAAYEEGFCETKPGRVRRIKVPRSIPTGWTVDQMQGIRDQCRTFTGFVASGSVKTKIPRAIAFEAIVQLLWCTGARLGDVLRIERKHVEGDTVWLRQSKTGVPLLRRLSPRARWLTKRMADLADSDPACRDVRHLLVPLTCNRGTVDRWLARAVRAAGIECGLSREIRRGASSVVHRETGQGGEFCGHLTPGLFHRHYEDPRITQAGKILSPPELKE